MLDRLKDLWPGYHLLNQFREQCAFTVFETAATSIIRKARPAAVLIENAAHGGALLARLKQKFKKIQFIAVEPKNSKIERLNRHRTAIRKGVISVSSENWAADFIAEFVNFPSGFTDQIDATTQYLDFMATKPLLKTPEPLSYSAGVYSDLTPINVDGASSPGPFAVALGSHVRRRC